MVAKPFTGRSLSLLAAWTIAMYFFMVRMAAQSPDISTVILLLFYTNLPLALYVIMLGLALKRKRVDEVRELFDIDAPRAGFAIMVGALATFAVLLFAVALWRDLQRIPMDLILLQAIIIVPSEEFSFRFFLPRVIPGRLIGIPAWVWAQITFAAFHFQAFQLDVFSMVFAFVFGVFLFLVADAKRKGESGQVPLLGLGAAIGIHFVWNLFSLSAGGTIGDLGSLFGWL